MYKAPTVFLCRNNRWAISTPTDKQTASESFAGKAIAYGIKGVRCDGNDALAVYRTVREAVERASRGEGPTLIELLTYRMGGHSTSDDPKAYRSDEEVETWQKQDPLLRLRRHLELLGAWHESDEKQLTARVDNELKQSIEAAEKKPQPALSSSFDDVYAERPWHLTEQLNAMPERSAPQARSLTMEMTMVQALNDALRGEMRRDDRVVLLGEDVGKIGGVFRVTQGLQDEFGDDRVIDTPLSEMRHHRHRRSAWPCTACGRCPRSSSPTSSTRRSTRS